MSFVGGKLKLKGGEPLKAAGGVKKKKKKSEEKSMALTSTGAEQQAPEGQEDDAEERTRKAIHGYELKQDDEDDRRTEAEKRFERRHRQLEEHSLKKQAQKSHRDRVKDFNEYLAKLSEHHDIPKVGPG